MAEPAITIIQQNGDTHGYIWDAEGAVNLRGKHRLLGSFLGGVANFKSQNIVSGLPLQVGSDEVQLAVSQGWAQVLQPTLQHKQATLTPTVPDQHANTTATTGNMMYDRKRRRGADADTPRGDSGPYWVRSYYEYYQGLGMYGEGEEKGEGSQQGPGTAAPTPPAGSQKQTGQQNRRDTGARDRNPKFRSAPAWLRNAYWLKLYYDYYDQQGAYSDSEQIGNPQAAPTDKLATQEGSALGVMQLEENRREEVVPGGDDMLGEGDEGMEGVDLKQLRTVHIVTGDSGAGQGIAAATVVEPWKAALQDSAPYVLPIQAPSTAQLPGTGGIGASGIDCVSTRALPDDDQLKAARYKVFVDLHSRGYALSAGPKFGSDLLAYPGDPCLFHAQFTVRVTPSDKPITPLALKAAARGSHAARKHLLLATVPAAGEGGGDEPFYITVSPEAGFGKAS